MKGLSKGIEKSLNVVLKGLNYDFFEGEAASLDSDKMKRIMDSKVTAFNSAKTILNKWINSPNAPNKKTIVKYVTQLIDSGDSAIKVLNKALEEDIDFQDLDEHKFDNAIKAKAIILEYIFSLDKSVKELRTKLESDDLTLSERDFKLGYPERFGRGDFYPIGDYYKDWYNEDKDAVKICPFSTEGEIITLHNLNIQLPAVPDDKSKILFYDKKREDQYWVRPEPPRGIDPDNVELFEEYILEEFRRRREGIWFMNNGKPVYLTGNMYFALTWMKMLDNGGYMDFRYAQLNMFYFSEACIVDKRCLGELFVKSRRTGFTYQIISIFLNQSTSTRNNNFGMTSKTEGDAEKAFLKYRYAMINLPFYFRPVIYGKLDSVKSFEFAAPADNTKASKKRNVLNSSDYLNSKIDYDSTKDDAYDGQALFMYLGDECLSPDTKILMSDMTFKKVSEVRAGEYVINGKGKTVEIGFTRQGKSNMYKVIQPYGKDYVVTEGHELLLNATEDNTTFEVKIKPTQFKYFKDSYNLTSINYNCTDKKLIVEDVTPLGKGDYVGVTLKTDNDEDRTLVLEDFTVTRNCGKWKKPHDYLNHWGTISPTMNQGGRIVGKAFLGSTVGVMAQGGEQFKKLYEASDITKRDETTKRTPSGLYSYFLAAQDNMESFTDKYGVCHTEKPKYKTYNVEGDLIETGSIEYLKAEEKAKQAEGDKAINAQYRAYPRTIAHAFRDESGQIVFNATKLYEQRDYNEQIGEDKLYTIGNFEWKNGVKDTEVVFMPNRKGRFYVSWLPNGGDGTAHLKNRYQNINGKFYPLNEDLGVISCDPFSVAGTDGSRGAMHGLTHKMPVGNAPKYKCFLEYIARPSDETVFFEDMIKASVFYGVPMCIERNRGDILRYIYNRGYREFVMNRLDRPKNKLSVDELKYGGQTMSGKDILDSHMNSIGFYVETMVGRSNKEQYRPLNDICLSMPFNRTIDGLLKFNPQKRTVSDETISLGLAIMAINKEKYKGKKKEKKTIKLSSILNTYSNKGMIGKKI